MRIAVICEYFYPDNSGSTPTDLAELTRYLVEQHRELQLDVVTSKNLYRPSGLTGKLSARENWQGVRIRRLPTPKSNRPCMVLRLLAGMLFSAGALLHLLRQPAYDLLLIVTNPPSNAMAAWLYSKLRSVPYIYVVHDLYPDIATAMGRLRPGSVVVRLTQRLQRTWLNSAARVVVLGRCMRRHLDEAYCVSLDRIRVIPNWYDTDSITASGGEHDFGSVNILAGFVALYAGNFGRYVNFDQILGAANLLRRDQGITFLLVGDGARRKEIVDRVAEEGLRNVIVLPSVPRAKMNQVLAVANVSLISLDPKMVGLGVPSKLYASLASGRPVVAMVPGQSEVAAVLLEEGCGVNVPDGDSTALASAIKHLQQNPELAKCMGRNARSALERRFTINHAAAKFWSLFMEVVLGKQESTNTSCNQPLSPVR